MYLCVSLNRNALDMITNEQIEAAWANADFESTLNKRFRVARSLLKYACGYSTGKTMQGICVDLGLIEVMPDRVNLTTLGREFLYDYFKDKV